MPATSVSLKPLSSCYQSDGAMHAVDGSVTSLSALCQRIILKHVRLPKDNLSGTAALKANWCLWVRPTVGSRQALPFMVAGRSFNNAIISIPIIVSPWLPRVEFPARLVWQLPHQLWASPLQFFLCPNNFDDIFRRVASSRQYPKLFIQNRPFLMHLDTDFIFSFHWQAITAAFCPTNFF